MYQSLLWKLQKDGGTPSYLFGTIHVYDPDIFLIPPEVYAALESCDLFAMEMDNRTLSYSEMVERMTSNDPDYSLEKLLSAEAYRRVMELDGVRGHEEEVNRYKPFFITSLVLSDYKEEHVSSVDAELASFARRNGKDVVGLETFKSQMDVVDSIPLSEQARMVEEAFAINVPLDESLRKMMYLYRDQDFEQMTQSMQLMSPSALFVDEVQRKRNVLMTERLDNLIHGNMTSVFAAVGALHLPDVGGIKGMLSLLAAKGYEASTIHIDLSND